MKPFAGSIAAAVVLAGAMAAAQVPARPPRALPDAAADALAESLEAAAAHKRHVWRDTRPVNPDGTINAYVEIPRGDRRKWEFDMRLAVPTIDREMPESLGGYPVNYGFVPRTLSYDGDPFDALVLGPPIDSGVVIRGAIVALLLMEDERGIDPKAVLSPLDRRGRPAFSLTDDDRKVIGGYFARYRQHEPGKFSKVTGWAPASAARAYIDRTSAFFLQCRTRRPCRIN